MSKLKFHFHPEDKSETRFSVHTKAPSDSEGPLYLGIVYQTVDSTWVADWTGRSAHPIAVPGFATKEHAADALYWFAAPVQSLGSRPVGQVVPLTDERTIDLSECACCITNHCECEGTNRVSQRFGIPQSYEIQPSLIPEHAALVSLLPMAGGDFLVDLNTRGAGTGIGYLQRRDDARYAVRVGSKEIGIASTPEAGMWATLQDHTGSKTYARLIKGFAPHKKPIYTLP